MPEQRALLDATSQAELDRLLLLVIHDLRAPLRQGLLHAQMLERSAAASLDLSSAASLQSILEANRMTNAFLSRLAEYCHAGVGPAASTPVGLDMLIHNAIQTVGTHADVQVTIDHAEPCSVPAVVQKILVEMLDNARKFRHGAVSIHIAAQCSVSECIVEVRDSGIGFAPQFSETIWEPLQRLHGVGEYPGFGFGLAISRRILNRIEGRSWSESTPGEGARFFFAVPLL